MKLKITKNEWKMIGIVAVVSILASVLIRSIGKGISLKDQTHSKVMLTNKQQTSFAFSHLFDWTMTNKASNNLKDFLTFIDEDTECILLLDGPRVVTEFGRCPYKIEKEAHKIPEWISNFGRFISIRTDVKDHYSVISLLENPYNVAINSVKATINPAQMFVKSEYFAALDRDDIQPITSYFVILFFLFTSVFVCIRLLVRNTETAERLHKHRNNISSLLLVTEILSKAKIEGISSERKRKLDLFRSWVVLLNASASKDKPIIKKHQLKNILQTVVEGVSLTRSEDLICLEKIDPSLFVESDRKLLIKGLYNIIDDACRELKGSGQKVYIRIASDGEFANIIISNPGTIKDIKRVIKKGYSNNNSSGLGMGIVDKCLAKTKCDVAYNVCDVNNKVTAIVKIPKTEGLRICALSY